MANATPLDKALSQIRFYPLHIAPEGELPRTAAHEGLSVKSRFAGAKHHIQFGCLFSQPSVSDLSVSKLPLHDSKYSLSCFIIQQIGIFVNKKIEI